MYSVKSHALSQRREYGQEHLEFSDFTREECLGIKLKHLFIFFKNELLIYCFHNVGIGYTPYTNVSSKF